MVPRPYAIVSCDFVVMYSRTLVGMMDHLLCTFISILGADGASSYNQGGYLDALAYVCIHNTDALHCFNQMCVCVCVCVYMTLWKIRFYFLLYSPPCFCYPWNRCIFSHKRCLIKWSSLCHAFYWSNWPDAILYTNNRAFFFWLKLVMRLGRSSNSHARYNRWKCATMFYNLYFPCNTGKNELYEVCSKSIRTDHSMWSR